MFLSCWYSWTTSSGITFSAPGTRLTSALALPVNTGSHRRFHFFKSLLTSARAIYFFLSFSYCFCFFEARPPNMGYCMFAITPVGTPSAPILRLGMIGESSAPPSLLSLGEIVIVYAPFLGESWAGPAFSSTKRIVLRAPSAGLGMRCGMKSLPRGRSKVTVSIVD